MNHINFDTKRHRRYKEYQQMYDNYEQEYLELLRIKSQNAYLSIALPTEVCRLYSDLAFSNPINAIVKDNKDADNAIDDIIEANNLNTLLSEASLTQSYKGGVVFKNYVDNGISKITFVEPDFYFPVFSPFDKRKVISETIAYPYLDENGKERLYTETYEQRNDGVYWCITQTFVYKNKKIGKELSFEEVDTQLKESPLTYVPFTRSGSSFWGDSIYKPLIPLFDALNNRVTQIQNVLDTHADPSMWALSSVFDDKGNLNYKGGKVFEVTEDENGKRQDPLGYITWDWSGEHSFKFIEDIIFKALNYVSPLAPSLYGLDQASQASGRSLLIKSWRTQCMVSRSYMYWREALKKILFVAQQLQVISGEANYTPAIPNIDLIMSIPSDFLENAQAEQLKVQAGISSKKSSIARMNPQYTSEEVEKEYQEIINEQAEEDDMTFMSRNRNRDDIE